MMPYEHVETAEEWLASGNIDGCTVERALACAAMAQAHLKAAELQLFTPMRPADERATDSQAGAGLLPHLQLVSRHDPRRFTHARPLVLPPLQQLDTSATTRRDPQMSDDTGHPTQVVVAIAGTHRWRAVCHGCLWTSRTYPDYLVALGEGEYHTNEKLGSTSR